jgi:hypothetical protein
MSHALHNAQSIWSITLRDNAPQLLNHAYLASLVPSNVSWGLRSSGMFGCLPTFRYGLSVTPSKVKQSKTGHIGCPETSVNSYQHTLRNNVEDRKPHLHDGGNLKSRVTQADCLLWASGKSAWRLSFFFPCLLLVWIIKSWRVNFGSDTTVKNISGCHRHPSLYLSRECDCDSVTKLSLALLGNIWMSLLKSNFTHIKRLKLSIGIYRVVGFTLFLQNYSICGWFMLDNG